MACWREDRFGITAIILRKNLCPSLHCLLFTSTDDCVLLLTYCTPFPFSDPLAPEYPVPAMTYFQDVYKETEAVLSCNIQYFHAALAVAKLWGFCSSSALMPGSLVSTPVCQSLPIASLHRWNYQNLFIFFWISFLPFSWVSSASTGTF